MVKIHLKDEQINALLKWRDEHKELVRACKEKDKRNKIVKIGEV